MVRVRVRVGIGVSVGIGVDVNDQIRVTLPFHGVPHDQRFVVRRRDELFPVWTEGDGIDAVFVSPPL